MNRTLLLVAILGCSPLQRSEAKQSVDSACVDAAFAAYVARPDPFVAEVGRFCMARSAHNTEREEALRAVGGTPARKVPTDDGFGWLPMHSAGAAGAAGVAGAASAMVGELWTLGDRGAAAL